MNFWFKKKKIVVDCFTMDPFAFEFARIDKASKFHPEWWKNLPSPPPPKIRTKIFEEMPVGLNMKRCQGFIDLYKNSFIIPFWGTLDIEVSDNKIKKIHRGQANYKVAHSATHPYTMHPPEQYRGFTKNNFGHVKILSPWYLRTKSDIRFSFTDPIWNRQDLTNYTVLPGIMDFKYQSDTSINIMVEFREDPRLLSFTPGQPMVHLTPLTSDEVELKYHLIEESKFDKYIPFKRISNFGEETKYQKSKKFIDNANENSSCPFSNKN